MKSTSFVVLLLLPFTAIICSEQHPKIAIIGGGIGGASAAHFVRNLFQSKKCDIHVYEPGEVGGRLATTEISGREYEAGGSVIHSKNFYMSNFTELLDLKRKDAAFGLLGIYNGEEYVFKETNWQAVNIAKLLWRYGWGIVKLWQWVNSLLDNFIRIYTIQEKGLAFSTMDQLLNAISNTFPNYTRQSFHDYLLQSGFSERIISELCQAATSVNYGQTTDINSFVGAVSMAGSDSKLWSVYGGNRLVPEKLFKEANAFIHKKKIKDIALLKEGTFEITITNDSEVEMFDIVIIAVPLIDGVSDITFNNFPSKLHNFRGKYHRTVATFVSGKVNLATFGLHPSDNLDGFIAVNNSLPYNSVGRVYPVDYKDGETVPEVWKIFSKDVLDNQVLMEMFETINEIKVVNWLAYPQYNPPDKSQPFILHPGMYYVNSVEWAASAMEMSAIAGRNAALLSYYFWTKSASNIDKAEPLLKDEL